MSCESTMIGWLVDLSIKVVFWHWGLCNTRQKFRTGIQCPTLTTVPQITGLLPSQAALLDCVQGRDSVCIIFLIVTITSLQCLYDVKSWWVTSLQHDIEVWQHYKNWWWGPMLWGVTVALWHIKLRCWKQDKSQTNKWIKVTSPLHEDIDMSEESITIKYYDITF